MRPRVRSACLLVVLATSSVARAELVTLDDALSRLRRDNLALVAARYELDAMRADVIAAGVLPNPTLLLDSHVWTHGLPTSGQQDVSVGLEQPLPLAGQVGFRRRAAQRWASAAEHDFAATAWTLDADLREAYLRLQLAQSRRQVLAAGVADLGRVEAVIRQRSAAGANPAYDTLRVAVERASVGARLSDADADLIAARFLLAQAIGKNVDAPSLTVTPLGDPPELAPEVDPTLTSATILKSAAQRPESLAAHLRLDGSTLHIRALQRAFLPVPTLGIGYTHWFHVDELPGARDGGALLLSLALPLPVFDHGQGVIGRAEAEARGAAIRADAVDLGLRRDAERALGTFALRAAAWRSYRDSTLGNIERLRQIAELSYKEGRASILELLDAYRSHLDSEERALELRGSALRAAQDLQRAAGPRL